MTERVTTWAAIVALAGAIVFVTGLIVLQGRTIHHLIGRIRQLEAGRGGKPSHTVTVHPHPEERTTK